MKNSTPLHFDFKEKSWVARLATWKLNARSVAIVVGHTIHLHRATKEELLSGFAPFFVRRTITVSAQVVEFPR